MTTQRALKRSAWLALVVAAAITGAQPETSGGPVEAAPADTTRADTAAAVVVAPVMPRGTEVSGEVSGTWERGTYLVKNTIEIQPGTSLTIAAGCTVLFLAPIERRELMISAQGRLDILGTEEKPVVLASAMPAGNPGRSWGGILYVGNRAEGRIENARIRHAEIGIQVRRGLIADEPATGDTANVLPANVRNRPTGPVRIVRCAIDTARFNGVVLAGVDTAVVVEDNTIRGCTSGIACEEGTTAIIRRNRILDNSSTGIMISGRSNPSISECMILRSTTAGIICANGSNPTIDRCVIARSGIGISTTSSSPRITRSTIANNDFSGIIAYDGAAPDITQSNVRGNGLASIDNRSTGIVTARSVWWGFITTASRPAPVLDGTLRRARGEDVPATMSGRVNVTDPLSAPSVEAPGTPHRAEELVLASDRALSRRFEPTSTVSHGDTIWIRVRATDESPFLEDEATIVINAPSITGGTQRVLTESGPATGTYEGYVVASLAAGDPNYVVRVQNGDVIRIETGTTPALGGQVTFVSRPPLAQALRVNGQARGVRLTERYPEFAWRYWDAENDAQAGIELELGTDPTWVSPPAWKHQEIGRVLAYTYDGPELAKGTTYYLRVRANDGYNWGPWRETSFHMNVPPPTPELVEPADGAIVTKLVGRDRVPLISARNVVDADGDRVSLEFEAFYGQDFANARFRVGGTAGAPVRVDSTTEVTVWKPPALTENTRIWWRVRATDGAEKSDWSAPRSFVLNTVNDLPQPFGLREPEADSTVRTLHPRFEWEYSYDPDPGETITFILTYGTDPNLRDSVTTIRVDPQPEDPQSYEVPLGQPLKDNTHYFWTVSVEQNGETLLRANEAQPDRRPIWGFFVDTGNDAPRVQYVPPVIVAEDGELRIRVNRYVSDLDNDLGQLKFEVRGTQHLRAEAGPGMEIVLRPERNWSGGPESVRFVVTDPNRSTGVGEVLVTVSADNDEPVLAAIPEQRVDEDTDLRLELTPFADDIDNRPEDLVWTASTDNRKLTVAIERGVATIRSAADWSGGPVPVRFTATDAGELSASVTAQVTIAPINDAPRVQQIPPIVMDEDTPTTIALDDYATDPDHPKDALVWRGTVDDPLRVTIDGATRRARLESPLDWSGIARRLTLTVNDPDGAANQIIAQVEVRAQNDGPVVSAIPDAVWSEDDSFAIELDPYVTDPDNQPREMTWSATGSSKVSVRIDAAARRAILRAPHNWYGGPESISVTATDPGGRNATRTVNASVRSVPEAPTLATIPAAQFDEDGAFRISLDTYLSDPDHTNAELTFAIDEPANVRAVLDRATRTLTLSVPANWNGGPETIAVTATDPDGERARTSFTATVSPVNDAPTIRAIPAIAFDEDTAATLVLTGFLTDPDDRPEAIQWAFSDGRSVETAVANGTARFRAPRDWNGSETLTLTATDPKGLAATARVAVTVRPVNDAPVLAEIPAVTWDEDGMTTLDLNALISDVDNRDDEMRWTVTGAARTQVSIARGIATFRADRDWNGAERLTFTANDPAGLRASAPVAVAVNEVADAPVFANVPSTRFDEDERTTVNLAPLATDVDGHAISWSATSPNSSIVAAVEGATLSLSAAQDWNGGPIDVTLTATDALGLKTNAALRVTVTAVNDRPVLAELPPVTFDEDGTGTLALSGFVTDVDNTAAQIKWTATPDPHVQVRIANGTATFTATKDWHGTEYVRIVGRDPDDLTAEGRITVTVRPVNDPPAVARVQAVEFDEDGRTTVDLGPLGSDPDGDAITWSATSPNPNVIAAIQGSILALSAAKDWNGENVNVTIVARDPAGGETPGAIKVSVRPANDGPVLAALPEVAFDEDGTANIDLSAFATDVDDAPNRLRWAADGTGTIRASFSGGIATFRATEDWSGTERILVTVTDRANQIASGALTVTVRPVNDPPKVERIPDIEVAAGGSEEYLLSPYAADPEDARLVWRLGGAPAGIDARVNETALVVSVPATTPPGSYEVRLIVSDGSAETATRAKIVVRPARESSSP